ncbi:sensor histidine kinase [Brevibacterium ammoniilyticum]|uniref:histidine kinase n=1 Tax=Brevibacterium ammoniilyticum TaxID=1046555 RepID=A0ABP9TZE1_9MICO
MAEQITAEERRPRARDWYLVVALGAGSAIFAALYDATGFWPFKVPLWVSCLASFVVAVPLVWRRRFPSWVAWVVSTIYVGAQFLGAMEPGVAQIAVFLAVYSVGAWQSDRRRAFVSRLLLCIAIFASLIAAAAVQWSNLGQLTVLQYAAASSISFLINIVFFGGAWVFGNRAWSQRRLMTELREANEEVSRQSRQLADQAIDLERVRIARELHDGVAHHIAGVGIHAAAARRSLEKNPEKARESLSIIESSTRETVDELRTLVHTLRDTEGQTASANRTTGNPGLGNPGLGDLPELIADARRAGQTIDVETLGTPRPLTPIMELSVFRVIQESLTNSRRYAGADAEVSVRLRYGVRDLEVEVSDSAAGPTAHQSVGTGLGIVGMRERIGALGGTLEAGPKSRGGWLVRARLPYTRNGATGTPAGTEATASASPAPDSAKA